MHQFGHLKTGYSDLQDYLICFINLHYHVKCYILFQTYYLDLVLMVYLKRIKLYLTV